MIRNAARMKRGAHAAAAARRHWGLGWTLAFVLFGLATAPGSRGELQFDVFLGLDDRVREGHWFPVAFEVFNDGPSFTGTVIVSPEGGLETQRRSFSLELPTGTRKRVVIPAFSTAGRYARWDAVLLDAKGRTIAERAGIQPKDTSAQVPILGAIPRTFGGLPTLPEFPNRGPEYVPAVVRLQPEFLPSDPIALDALTACYLNSEKAADLKAEQADALLAWVHGGGHLVVGIEQPADVNAVPWLRGLVPFSPLSLTNVPSEGSFERWLVSGRRVLQLPSVLRGPRSTGRRATTRPSGQVRIQTPPNADPDDPFTRIPPQDSFNNAEIPVVTGRVIEGEVVLELGGTPLVVSAPRGHGTVTVLAFSPEREPFRGWKNRAWFWAKLISVPPTLLQESGELRWGGSSIDGIFGAMLDSRQVRKLPIGALLALLVVYLAVIGPFDQWILKRIGRQMWTWVTFPVYVVLFSTLIYFIGYRLRAGELEWNELQVVDQLSRNQEAAYRGRTWVSIYSPGNARYRIASEQPFATLRSELQPSAGGLGTAGRMQVRLPPRGFDASAFVPVWVSQVFVSDWLETGPAHLSARISHNGDRTTLALENRSQLRFASVRVVYAGRIHELGELAPGQRIEPDLARDGGSSIEDFLDSRSSTTLNAIRQRRFAFGREGSGRIEPGLDPVVVASFTSLIGLSSRDPMEAVTAPAGFDVAPLLARGDAIVFAWAPGQAVASPIYRFTPPRVARGTVLRLAVPSGRGRAS